MSVEAFRKRIMYRHFKPNALFESWIRELLAEAVERKSKLEPMLREAYESLRKYPLPLKSGSDCAILKGFHKKLCKFLDHRFSVYESIILEEARAHGVNEDDANVEGGNEICERKMTNSERAQAEAHPFNRSNPLIPGQRMPHQYVHFYFRNLVPTPYIQNSARCQPAALETQRTAPSTSKTTQKSTFKPAYRSGAYAILLTLLKHARGDSVRSLPKEQIIEFAQQYCDESFTVIKPGTNYTAWRDMLRLGKRGLVNSIRKKKMEFTLTDAGKDLAIDLLIEDTERTNISNVNSVPMIPASAVVNEAISFQPGSYDVVLLIDKNETGGASKKNEPTVALFNRYPRVKHEYRTLKVGDFAWIARHHVTKQELVLPYIVERKRMDDLAGSIKDGRFHEQKFRLHKCGLSNVFYMVENHGKNKNLGLPLQALKQALANTRVQDGFKTIVSDSLANSVRLIALLTIKLTAEYREESLTGRNDSPRGDELMTYEYFSMVSSKNKSLTVTELFIKQLLQLKGLSIEKALAITKRYPTPMLLVDEYKKHDAEGGLMLLANLKYGDLRRNVGPQVSRTIYQLYSDENM